MLSPRLSDCTECASITSLLSDIDCKITDLAKAEYNNITLSLGNTINRELTNDLLTYKEILMHRLVNGNYACSFTTNQIASRIKLLKYK
jgi:hypothetical protein